MPETLLAIVLVLTTVVSAGYYLYVIMVIFMRAPGTNASPVPRTPILTRVVLATTVIGILVLGVYPNWLREAAMRGLPRVEDASLPDFLGDAPRRAP
jgi:NADH-quinone oxidoreductase subunit N